MLGVNRDEVPALVLDIDHPVTTGVHIQAFEFQRHIRQCHVVGDGDFRIGGMREQTAFAGIHDMASQRDRPAFGLHRLDDQRIFLLAVLRRKIIIRQLNIAEILTGADRLTDQCLLGCPKDQVEILLASLNEPVDVDILGIDRDAVSQQVGCVGINAERVDPVLHIGDRGRGGPLGAPQQRAVGQENPNRIAPGVLHEHAQDIDRVLGLNEDLARLNLPKDRDRPPSGGVQDIKPGGGRDDVAGDVNVLAWRNEAGIRVEELVDIGNRDTDLGIGLGRADRPGGEIQRHNPIVDILGTKIVVFVISLVVAVHIPGVLFPDQCAGICRGRNTFRHICAVEIHPTIEGRNRDSGDLQLRMGVVLDLDPRVLGRVEETSPGQIIRQDTHAAGLRIGRLHNHHVCFRQARHDCVAPTLGKPHIEQFLLKAGNLVEIEALQILVAGALIERQLFARFFNFFELWREDPRTDHSEVNVPSGVAALGINRCEILDNVAVCIDLQDQGLEAFLTGDNLSIVAHFGKEHRAALAIAGADISAAQSIGDTRRPVGGLGHTLDTHITPAIGIDVDIAVAFETRAGLDVDQIGGLVERHRLEVGNRDRRACKVVHPGLVVLIRQVQVPVDTRTDEHVARRPDMGACRKGDLMCWRDIGTGGTNGHGRGTEGLRIGLQIGVAAPRGLKLKNAMGIDIGPGFHNDTSIKRIGIKPTISSGTGDCTAGNQFHLVGVIENVAHDAAQITGNPGDRAICRCDLVAGGIHVGIDAKPHLGVKADRGVDIGTGTGRDTARLAIHRAATIETRCEDRIDPASRNLGIIAKRAFDRPIDLVTH